MAVLIKHFIISILVELMRLAVAASEIESRHLMVVRCASEVGELRAEESPGARVHHSRESHVLGLEHGIMTLGMPFMSFILPVLVLDVWHLCREEMLVTRWPTSLRSHVHRGIVGKVLWPGRRLHYLMLLGRTPLFAVLRLGQRFDRWNLVKCVNHLVL